MKIIHIPQCASLMDEMKKMSECPVALYTDFQTAGRGQHDHVWESQKGKNLLCGIIFDSTPLKTPENVSRHTVESVMKTLDFYLENSGRKTRFKSPNDIYIDDRKICGMLIENYFQSGQLFLSHIGLGINVNEDFISSNTLSAVSLKDVLGYELKIEEVFAKFIDNFELR